MTNEEAISLLRRFNCNGCKYMIACTRNEDGFCYEASAMGAKTLEKQIPKKPIEDGYFDRPCVCPECGQEFGFNSGFKYCENCGQAIDWSDEDDQN